jgi:hypothetical protein
MRAHGLILAGAVLGATLVGPLASAAGAETLPPALGGGSINEDGDPTAEAEDPGALPVNVGSGDSPWSCTASTVLIEDDFVFAVWEVEGTRAFSTTGRWLTRTCTNSDTGAIVEQGFPEGGTVDPAALALQAQRSVSIAAPGLAASPAIDRGFYVRVPTWLWVDGSWWQTYSATATAGRVTATVTARPVNTSWTMGDGASMDCEGGGTPWRPGLSESASTCSHTYTSASDGEPDQTFSLGATVTLEVAWTSNTGQSGTLPNITRTATQPVRVSEIQAIETR